MARSRVQSIRSNVSGARPASQEPGTIYTNWADRQIGVADSTRQPMDMVAVRYFATTASYTPGQLVVHNGKVYRATAVISPGAFNAAQWQEISVQSGSGIWVSDSPPAQAPLQGQLLWESDSGDLFVWYEDADGGQWVQINVVGDVGKRLDITSYGAQSGGLVDAFSAIGAMGAAVGFAVVPRGNFRVDTGTVDYPLYFDPGGYFTVNTGQTVTITERIDSSRQWIFQGAGTVLVSVAADSGEDARMLHASWFGAIPKGQTVVDQKPYLQKALNAFGSAREGILELDVGSYRVESGLTVPRGVHVKGAGMRRTIIDVVGAGYDVFTTTDVAVKFTGVMFEQPTGAVAYRTGALIRVNHDDCELEDIWLWCSEFGIVIAEAAKRARLRNICGSYSAAMPAATAMILVQGQAANIDGVRQLSAVNGPTALVEIGRDLVANSGFHVVRNVHAEAPSIPVLINANVKDVSRVLIEGVVFAANTAPAIEAVVKLKTSGAANITSVIINDVISNSIATAIVRIEQTSSGTTRNILLGSMTSTTGDKGVELIQTAGTLRDVIVSDTSDFSERTTPFARTGTMSNIRVSPAVVPLAGETYNYFQNIADDTAWTINLYRSIFSGVVEITAGVTRHGLFTVRAASSPAVSANRITDANTVALLTLLAGTTGVDGNLTLGVTDGVLYVENRLGSAQNISVSVRGV